MNEAKELLLGEEVSGALDLYYAIEELSPGAARKALMHLYEGLKPESSEFTQYQSAEALSMMVYPKYKFSDYSRIFLEDEPFLDYYQRFMDPGNWHTLDRKYTLDQLLKLTSYIPGDIVECGTYKGVSAYLMCKASVQNGKIVHLFDSFEGLSEPGEFDGSYWEAGRFFMPEENVHNTLAQFSNYKAYKGWIPDRFSEISDKQICFLHIDVDLYEPTKDSLEYFYPRLVPNGVILMDDYGTSTCPGAKKAADEFFADKPEEILLLTTGQGLVIKKAVEA